MFGPNAFASGQNDKIEIYHDFAAPNKFLVFRNNKSAAALFDIPSISATVTAILTTKFTLSEVFQDSALEAQEEFNLFVDNSPWPKLISTVLKENLDINEVEFNFNQKVTLSTNASLEAKFRMKTTLVAQYSFHTTRGAAPVFLGADVRAINPLTLIAYYIAPNQGEGNVPIYKKPPAVEDKLILGLVDSQNNPVSFVRNKSVYTLEIKNVGFSRLLSVGAHGEFYQTPHLKNAAVNCLLGKGTNPYDQDRGTYDAKQQYYSYVILNDRQALRDRRRLQNTLYTETRYFSYHPEMYRPHDIVYEDSSYPAGKRIPAQTLNLTTGYGPARGTGEKPDLWKDSPTTSLKLAGYTCNARATLPWLLHDGVNLHEYCKDCTPSRYPARLYWHTRVTVGGVSQPVLQDFMGRLPILNRVEKILLGVVDNYRYPPTPARKTVARKSYQFAGCYTNRLETTYVTPLPPALAADVSYYDIDVKARAPSRVGGWVTYPHLNPLAARALGTRVVSATTDLVGAERSHLRGVFAGLTAVYTRRPRVASYYNYVSASLTAPQLANLLVYPYPQAEFENHVVTAQPWLATLGAVALRKYPGRVYALAGSPRRLSPDRFDPTATGVFSGLGLVRGRLGAGYGGVSLVAEPGLDAAHVAACGCPAGERKLADGRCIDCKNSAGKVIRNGQCMTLPEPESFCTRHKKKRNWIGRSSRGSCSHWRGQYPVCNGMSSSDESFCLNKVGEHLKHQQATFHGSYHYLGWFDWNENGKIAADEWWYRIIWKYNNWRPWDRVLNHNEELPISGRESKYDGQPAHLVEGDYMIHCC